MLTSNQVARLKAVLARYPDHRLAKYRDWRAACNLAESYLRLLRLHTSPPLGILDLGGGLSYFAALCQRYGHKAITLDLPDAMPQVAAEALDVGYIPHLIVARVPLPGTETYDLITAFRLNMTEPDRWGWDEYADFADDVLSRLRLGGRWFMAPNRGENVAFVLDCQRWQEILGDRATATNPTRNTVLITTR